MMPEKPRVAILGVGGTIASVQTSNGFKPQLEAEYLMEAIPEISRYCDIECHDIMNIDSSNLQPEDWETIVLQILERVNDNKIDGIVVTHGTDTLSYTASAAAILMRNLGKPVVFTGSQIPLPVFGSDAHRNLIDAIRVASSNKIAESVIVFNSGVYRGCRTVKLREFELSAFETVNPTPLAEIARRINVIDDSTQSRTNAKAWYDGPLDTNVALMKAFPGMKPHCITSLIDLGYKGVVIEGYGTGNLPIMTRSLMDPIKQLIDQGITVVVTTQCVFGRTELLLYETGRNFLDMGVISGHDMLSEVALIKLMWALGKTSDPDQVQALMHTNLANEISHQHNE